MCVIITFITLYFYICIYMCSLLYIAFISVIPCCLTCLPIFFFNKQKKNYLFSCVESRGSELLVLSGRKTCSHFLLLYMLFLFHSWFVLLKIVFVIFFMMKRNEDSKSNVVDLDMFINIVYFHLCRFCQILVLITSAGDDLVLIIFCAGKLFLGYFGNSFDWLLQNMPKF